MIQRLRRFYWSLVWFDSLSFSTGENMFYCYKRSGLFRFAFNTFFKRTKAQVQFMGLYWPNIPIKGIYILIVYSQFEVSVKPGGAGNALHELLSPLSSFITLLYLKFLFKSRQARRLVLSLILVNEFGRHVQKCL